MPATMDGALDQNSLSAPLRSRDNLNSIVVIIIVVVAIIFLISMRIAKEHERFAVFILDRYAGLKGPGLVMKWPGLHTEFHRIAIGDKGKMISREFARFDKAIVLIARDSEERYGAIIAVTNFSDGKICVGPLNEALRKT